MIHSRCGNDGWRGGEWGWNLEFVVGGCEQLSKIEQILNKTNFFEKKSTRILHIFTLKFVLFAFELILFFEK